VRPSAIDTLVQNLKASMEQYERESKAETAHQSVLSAVREARASGLSHEYVRSALQSRGLLVSPESEAEQATR
jgi:hypothetical protein